MRAFHVAAFAIALGACRSPSPEIAVIVDAEDAIVDQLASVRIDVLDDTGAVTASSTDVALTGTRPDCLPLSVGVVPTKGGEGLAVTIEITGKLASKDEISHRIRTHFASGLRKVEYTFPAQCASAPASCAASSEVKDALPADRADLDKAIMSATCRAHVDPIACVDRGGCFASSDAVCAPCPDSKAPDPPAAPKPADPPSHPDLPCPMGWTAKAPDPSDGLSGCEPWPMDQLPECPDGQARFPGDPACAELDPCPLGQFAAGLDPAIYVDANAPAGGNGTVGAPIRTLAEALMHTSASGGRIALSKGMHVTAATSFDRAIDLAGACASMTMIVSAQASPAPLFSVTSSGARIRDITISSGEIDVSSGVLHLDRAFMKSPRGSALTVRHGAQSIVLGVAIDAPSSTAILAENGARAALDRVIIRGAPQAIAATGDGTSVSVSRFAIEHARQGTDLDGFAIGAFDRAKLVLSKGIVEGSEGRGVLVRDATTALDAEDLIVRDMLPNPDGKEGEGISIVDCASMTGRLILIERTRIAGVQIGRNGCGAHASISDLTIRDVTSSSADTYGYGIECQTCGLVLARGSIARGSLRSLDLIGGSHAEAQDLSVSDTRYPGASHNAWAIYIEGGSTLHLLRGELKRNGDATVFADTGSRATFEHLAIRDTMEQPGGGAGKAVFASSGAWLHIERAVFERNHDAAVQIFASSSTNATVEIVDAVISGTRPTRTVSDTGSGFDVGLSGSGMLQPKLTLRRVAMIDNRGKGISANNATIHLEDVSISGTKEEEPMSDAGFGLWATTGSKIDGVRVAIDLNTNAGVRASDGGTMIDLSHVSITDTACNGMLTTCSFGGSGVVAETSAKVHLSFFSIEKNTLNGIQIDPSSGVDLEDGAVTHNEVGALVPSGFDQKRIAIRVRYDNVRRNIELPP